MANGVPKAFRDWTSKPKLAPAGFPSLWEFLHPIREWPHTMLVTVEDIHGMRLCDMEGDPDHPGEGQERQQRQQRDAYCEAIMKADFGSVAVEL